MRSLVIFFLVSMCLTGCSWKKFWEGEKPVSEQEKFIYRSCECFGDAMLSVGKSRKEVYRYALVMKEFYYREDKTRSMKNLLEQHPDIKDFFDRLAEYEPPEDHCILEQIKRLDEAEDRKQIWNLLFRDCLFMLFTH